MRSSATSATKRKLAFPSDEEYDCLVVLGNQLKEDNGYLLLGFEIGTQMETPHIQGYMRFKSPRCFRVVRNLLCTRSHIEQARGAK